MWVTNTPALSKESWYFQRKFLGHFLIRCKDYVGIASSFISPFLMNSLRMICSFLYTVLRDVCLKTDFECSIKREEQRPKSPLTEEALEFETSRRNCWLSKICYFTHLPGRETIWSCRCCNFTFKWKSLGRAVYLVGPSGRCVQRCTFNCHRRWPLKTQYSALSFCQLPAVYWTTAKQQQEFCNLSFFFFKL